MPPQEFSDDKDISRLPNPPHKEATNAPLDMWGVGEACGHNRGDTSIGRAQLGEQSPCLSV